MAAGGHQDAASVLESFSEQELSCYRQLLSAADTSGSGLFQGNQAVEFLQRFGLPQATLRSIWAAADPASTGYLDAERFFVAMRLVAHAQCGRSPDQSLLQLPPERPPEMDALAPMSSEKSLSSSWSGSSRSLQSQRPPHWVPSERQKRKYATLFLRADSNMDGFVEAQDAKDICERSGLSEDVMGLAWQHADRDQDGRLSFPEFAALIHILSCARGGLSIPQLEQGLPSELEAALSALAVARPAELDAQRSRPSSRGSSPSRSPSPAAWTESNVRPASSGEPPRRPPPLSDPGLELPLGSREASACTPSSPRFGTGVWLRRQLQFDSSTGLEGQAKEVKLDVALISRQLSSMLASDRCLLQHLQQEVVGIEAKLQQSLQEYRSLRPKVVEAYQEQVRLNDLGQELERRISEGKHQLAVASEERRRLAETVFSGAALQEHVSGELVFLKQVTQEESRNLEEMRSSNSSLEESCRSRRTDLEELRRTRAELLEQAEEEARLLRADERRREASTTLSGSRPMWQEELQSMSSPSPWGCRSLMDLDRLPAQQAGPRFGPDGQPLEDGTSSLPEGFGASSWAHTAF